MKNKAAAVRQHMLSYEEAESNTISRSVSLGHRYDSGVSRSIPQKIMLAGIRFYRRNLSPLKQFKCPYIPTCSEYGLQAVEKYGALKGGLMALWRILRCNPFSHGGYDPVP